MEALVAKLPLAERSPASTEWRLAKKPFLKDALGELNLEVMKRIKKSFDSNGILNPWEDFLMNAHTQR